ncbi:PREDICTED: uncharacterized protein LOC108773502 [Cyphomyrmex costatus]|uniref:Double jelly roll-like domain-containing protein n=1 Tax=Cyphomyrmex costatus TaxID=456900 RepID=A0A151IJT8_9HYME|nr:PREDICTED: uncharacterized protein LOC108773502 [Cyphomyrmex costatus]KYN03346.1 hypothetical protein ALC62_05811 [Cyphomyrmex costatus]
MADILDFGGEPIFDDRIVKYEFHTYNPYVNTTFGHSDEIRIPIQQQDLYTLPCESCLYVEGRLTSKEEENAEQRPKLGINCVAFMFEEIRYELNGSEIDRNRNVGITTLLKGYSTHSADFTHQMENAGFVHPVFDYDVRRLVTEDGYFSFYVPLHMLFGFCEDYKRVVINARHELILIRARNDNNCIVGDAAKEPKLELFKIQWRMPHVTLNEVNKLSMLRILENGRYLSMSFRSWDLYEYPLLPSTTKLSWAIKTTTQLEKPRYVIFALQTNKKNNMSAHKTFLDSCKLTNVKLYLNSEFFPYDDLNLDFDKNRTAILYDMFVRFRTSYYQILRERSETLFKTDAFRKMFPMVIIDCSRQNESVKSGTVDVRLEFEFKENVPANTTAYCLIIHDRVIEYSPMSNVVRKIT